jgi:uncharacterized glyoxalase superfamily protein PhnB/predicted enzyme related to lactoylglutathione lyase
MTRTMKGGRSMTDISTPDPFDALRRPDAPIAPSTAFAKQLRQRLVGELQPLLAANTTSSATTRTTTRTTTNAQERAVTMTVTPYLMIRNAAAALDFYRDAFGAVETHRLVGDDGRVGHAEIMIGTSKLMLADEYPEINALGPESRGGPTCSFDIDVVDAAKVDETFELALTLGATALRPPADQFHGSRSATVSDPFGHQWTFSALIEQLSLEDYAVRAAQDTGHGSFAIHTPDGSPDGASDATQNVTPASAHPQAKHHTQGDLYYFTLPVRDMARAQRFFGAVLGWRFDTPEYGHVVNISAPPGGINDKNTDTGARLWFVVDDIHAAVEAVREMGGTAEDPVNYDSGWSSDCTDDQGTEFSLSVPSPEYSA